MKTNKTKIQITYIKNYGRNHELYCDKVLMLRKARKVGDKEIVNNTQLSALKRAQGSEFGFIILDTNC